MEKNSQSAYVVTRVYKELSKFTNKKIISSGKWTFRPSLKKIYGLQLCTCKDVHHHYSLENAN